MIRIWINNEWQEFKELKGIPYKTAIDDSLDTATAIFYADFKEPIAKNTYVEIYNGIIMIVYNDQSIPISKYKNKWQHTLSLIEPTHLLDQIPCNNICLTKQYSNLYPKFLTMSKNIYFYSQKTNPSNENKFDNSEFDKMLSDELRDRLSYELSSPEIYCSNMTAKECYNELLKTINGRIELIVNYLDYKNEFEYILDYRSGDKRKQLITFNEMSSVYTYDSNNMINNLTYNAKNVVTRYPISQGYEGFKTTETTLTTENASIILNHEIEDIVSFMVKVDAQVDLQLKKSGEDTIHYTFRYIPVDVDITENFIEQEAYDLMTSTEQQNYIPYTKNNVIVPGKLDLIQTIVNFTGSKIESIVKEKINDVVNNNPDIVRDFMTRDEEYPYPEYIVYNISPTYALHKAKIDKMAYKITYYPFLNINGKITKNISKNSVLSIYDNQQEEVLSLERYSDYLENKLNRIGNTEIEIDEINQPLKSLNSYTEDGYVIYEREISSALNEVKAHYKLSKDYNMLNSRLAVDQKKRLYEIPKDYEDCYLMPKYTMSVSTKTIQEAGDFNREKQTLFIDEAIISCIKTLTKRDSSSVYGIWFKTENWDNEEPKYLYCSTYAFQKTLHFLALTYDNYSAALSVGGRVLGGKKAVYNPYVDERGEFTSLQFKLCGNNKNKSLDELLKYPSEEAKGEVLTYTQELDFAKDRVQRICFDINFEIQSIDEDVYIGKEFYQNNELLQNNYIPELFLWYSRKEKYDKKPLIAKGAIAGVATSYSHTISKVSDAYANYFKFEYIGEPIQDVKSWAIADENGKIYLAVNGAIRPIYFT